jgi:hypothetical protein
MGFEIISICELGDLVVFIPPPPTRILKNLEWIISLGLLLKWSACYKKDWTHGPSAYVKGILNNPRPPRKLPSLLRQIFCLLYLTCIHPALHSRYLVFICLYCTSFFSHYNYRWCTLYQINKSGSNLPMEPPSLLTSQTWLVGSTSDRLIA